MRSSGRAVSRSTRRTRRRRVRRAIKEVFQGGDGPHGAPDPFARRPLVSADINSPLRRVDSEAYANLKIVTAQAEALPLQDAASAQNPDVPELRRIEVEQTKAERWNGALPTSVYAGTPILFFNPQSGK